MAGIQLKRGPNRWVMLHSDRDTTHLLTRFWEVAPSASAVVASPITGIFTANAITTRQNLSPVPRAPRNARAFLLEFQGDGGIIVWPGSTESDPMLSLDAVLVPPAAAGATEPAAPGPVLAPATEPTPAAGAGTAAAAQVGIVALGLGVLWWLLSRH